jgi:hypothetical protein
MPADFFINPQFGTVFSKAIGIYNYADVRDHMVTRMELSGDEIRDLATRTIFSAHSKRATVVKSDHDFGIGRMFGTYREIHGEESIRVFRIMAEALAWLSLNAEPDPKRFTRLTVPATKD